MKVICAAKHASIHTIAPRSLHSRRAISISILSAENIPPSIAAAEFRLAVVGVGLALPSLALGAASFAVQGCGF